MPVELYDHQRQALPKLKNGSILCGGVGSGKSRTALAYFYTKECDGDITTLEIKKPCDLYIITTARKRDTFEWEAECEPFMFGNDVKITIDSWNNIGKYTNVFNSFFIFDEQRVVGSGAWVKAFLRITKMNRWILLSATPGDTWLDYIPVFIANGFYKNRTEFIRRHVTYNRYSRYPKVDHYMETGRLIKLRQSILVNMRYRKETVQHNETVIAGYDLIEYKSVIKERKDPETGKPFKNISALCYGLRKVTNSSPDRIRVVTNLIKQHPKVIIFYNFDYELEILRQIGKDLDLQVAEYNSHKHMPVPKKGNWIYLVQYMAGAEGWNCTETNTIIFYSQNYSYKMLIQAAGRIDRLNTPFTDLYYYHVRSNSSIDLAINSALKRKKNFNVSGFSIE